MLMSATGFVKFFSTGHSPDMNNFPEPGFIVVDVMEEEVYADGTNLGNRVVLTLQDASCDLIAANVDMLAGDAGVGVPKFHPGDFIVLKKYQAVLYMEKNDGSYDHGHITIHDFIRKEGPGKDAIKTFIAQRGDPLSFSYPLTFSQAIKTVHDDGYEPLFEFYFTPAALSYAYVHRQLVVTESRIHADGYEYFHYQNAAYERKWLNLPRNTSQLEDDYEFPFQRASKRQKTLLRRFTGSCHCVMKLGLASCFVDMVQPGCVSISKILQWDILYPPPNGSSPVRYVDVYSNSNQMIKNVTRAVLRWYTSIMPIESGRDDGYELPKCVGDAISKYVFENYKFCEPISEHETSPTEAANKCPQRPN